MGNSLTSTIGKERSCLGSQRERVGEEHRGNVVTNKTFVNKSGSLRGDETSPLLRLKPSSGLQDNYAETNKDPSHYL